MELTTEARKKIKEAIRKGYCKDETEAINLFILKCDIGDLAYDEEEVRPEYLKMLEKRIRKNDTIEVKDFAKEYGLK